MSWRQEVEDCQRLGFTETEQRELFQTNALRLLGMEPEPARPAP